MFLHKKWMLMLMAITVALLLVACGDKEMNGEKPANDVGQQDGSPQDISKDDALSLSGAFEEHSLWFKITGFPLRDSRIEGMFVFENGKVKEYQTTGGYLDNEPHFLTLEDTLDMSDEELIDFAEGYEDIMPGVDGPKGGYLPERSGEYTLDLALDEVGQNVASIQLLVEQEDDSVSVASSFYEGNVSQKIFDQEFSGFRFHSLMSSGNLEDKTLITRVDASSVLFKLDNLDVDKENVTIEEWDIRKEWGNKKVY